MIRATASHQFEAIGTRWDIRILERIESERWSGLVDVIRRRIEAFDKSYSRFRNDSLVARMAHRAGRYELPPDGDRLLQFYEQLYEATAGKVTPLIGQIMEASGYDASYSFSKQELRRPPAWEDVLSYEKGVLTLLRPALIDFGAAGKGGLVDIVSELIETAGIRSYVVNAGGDIRYRSAASEMLEIGLENPLDGGEAVGIARLGNGSLCASAGSKRQWGNFHHIIDPQTLESPSQVLAAWVIADETMTADGLATALFFADPAELQQEFSFSYAVLHQGMELQHSADFPAKIFTAQTS